MADPWHFADLGIRALQTQTKGEGIRVAILDSGVADIGGTFASLRSVSPASSPTSNTDTVGHGSVCASLIASLNDEAPGIAPRVELVSIPVVISGQAAEGLVRDAFNVAVAEGCQVISCSFTLPTAQNATLDAIRAAANQGVVVVAASGNDPNVAADFPERTPNVLVVGPYGHKREVLPSHQGPFVDVYGPGIDLPVVTMSGQIDSFGESSGATAVVAGVAALILSATRNLGTARVGLALEGLAKSTAMMSGSARLIDPDRCLHAAQQLP